MLKSELLHPEILRITARAGHHSKILIADGNYPVSTKKGPNAELVCLQLTPGVPTVAASGLPGYESVGRTVMLAPAKTPAAIIRWGSYEGQQTITGSLNTIADEAELAGLRPPAVIVIGEVVKLRERLKWFEERVSGYACGDLDAEEFGPGTPVTKAY